MEQTRRGFFGLCAAALAAVGLGRKARAETERSGWTWTARSVDGGGAFSGRVEPSCVWPYHMVGFDCAEIAADARCTTHGGHATARGWECDRAPIIKETGVNTPGGYRVVFDGPNLWHLEREEPAP